MNIVPESTGFHRIDNVNSVALNPLEYDISSDYSSDSASRILAYCHIGKVGGKKLQFYFRTHFGLSSRCVSSKGAAYSKQELESDLRWNPFIKYLGGHGVRPHVDYGDLEHRLDWFSFFRNPLTRVLSHFYQQKIVLPQCKDLSLMDWMALYPNRAYWQIYMIAGEKNLAKAKDIIDEKFSFVGLTEYYEQSLFLLSKHFDLKGFRFADGRSSAKPEQLTRFDLILDSFEAHEDDIKEILQPEIEFYDFVVARFKKQCEQYGQDNLSRDLNSYIENSSTLPSYNLNELLARGMDRLFWRPRTSCQKWMSS